MDRKRSARLRGHAAEPSDRAIAALARRQHGVVCRRQPLGIGLSADRIEGRLRRGTLHAVYRGVYAAGHTVLSAQSRPMAAVLACGPDAVLSHRSAGQLWRIVPRPAIAPEVTRPRSFRERPGIRVHRMALRPDEVTEVDGTPVTSVFRTVFDLAATRPPREVERAFHEAEVRRLTDRVSLPMLLERYPRQRGARVIRQVLASEEPLGITDNEFEERFHAFLLGAYGFERPIFNGTLALRGRLLRPDCMWPKQRLIVELDSRAVHDTDRGFQGDRRRDRELLAAGWRSMRVTWAQLRDEPDAVARDLRLALACEASGP